MAKCNILSYLAASSFNSAYAYSADIFIIVYIREQKLERAVHISRRSRYLLKYLFKKRLHIRTGFVRIKSCIAVTSRSVYNREFKLVIISAKLYEKVKYLVNNFLRSCTGAVYLIYDNKRLFAKTESLFQNEACLRHTSLKCINKQENAIYHHKYALNLASEISMSGSIDNIYLCTLIHYCRIL